MTHIRLRHVVQVNPSAPAFDRLPADAEVTFLPMENVWPGDKLDITLRRAKSSVTTGYTRFQQGDVLVPKITPTFEASRSVWIRNGLCNGAGAGTTELHVLRATEQIDPRFLLYITHSYTFLQLGEAEMYGVAGQKRVPDDFLRNFSIFLPNLDEQRRVAGFLDMETSRIQEVQEVRSQQRAALEERELALIAYHLGGLDEPGERRPTPWPWLPSLPRGWRIGPVYAYYEVLLGKMLNAERASGPSPKPYLRNANVHWYEVSIDDLATMSFEPGERKRYLVKSGDLLVCEGGAGVAEAAIWDGRMDECFYQKSLHRIRRRADLPVEWLMYWLRLAKHVGVFASEGNIATIPHLTAEQLREYRIPIPVDADRRVRTLAREIEQLSSIRNKLSCADELLSERRRALITAAVTGQIDVTTARGAGV